VPPEGAVPSASAALRERLRMPRRRFLAAAALAGLSVGGLSACASDTNKPDALSLWLWKNSADPDLLSKAAGNIEGTSGVTLASNVIGGDFKSKLLTTLAGRSHVPDLTFINSDIASYFPNADQFVDLYALGAKDHQSEFLKFKWNFGVTPAGRMIGYPMDTGPTALFFRSDVLNKAGLPSEPDAVHGATSTWDDFLAFGSQIAKAVEGGAITPTITALFTQVMAQSAKQYFEVSGAPIYDQEHVQRAFEYAVKAHELGVSANAQTSTDQTALLGNGKQVCQTNAVWWVVAGPEQLAPKTKGNWRVCAAPGSPGNYGGSFVAITKYCKNPEAAYKFITWLENEQNEITSLAKMFLFPSRLDALESDAIAKPYDFFGNQKILEVFAESAKGVPTMFLSPYDALVSGPITDELTNVEAAGKKPADAWSDAMKQVKRELDRAGAL
jgi:cellobiose transport system substrate-binding protein